jgi:hypothetical protein
VTLYGIAIYILVGYTFSSFWRQCGLPVRVNSRVESGLHLLQLFPYRQREGCWWSIPPTLARPAAATAHRLQRLRLIVSGRPGRTAGRPSVIKEIVFDPATLTFTSPSPRRSACVSGVDEERITIEIKLDMTVKQIRPFAALRSMFVTETNADVARAGWRSPRSL